MPLKKLTPNIAKTIMKTRDINITLSRAFKELKIAFTTSFNPSFLLITLKGLNALKALKAFNDFKEDFA